MPVLLDVSCTGRFVVLRIQLQKRQVPEQFPGSRDNSSLSSAFYKVPAVALVCLGAPRTGKVLRI